MELKKNQIITLIILFVLAAIFLVLLRGESSRIVQAEYEASSIAIPIGD